MNKTKTAEAIISLSGKTSVKIEFNRYGQKDKPKTKEFFWLSRAGGFTLEDLKTIAKEAEELLRIVNE